MKHKSGVSFPRRLVRTAAKQRRKMKTKLPLSRKLPPFLTISY